MKLASYVLGGSLLISGVSVLSGCAGKSHWTRLNPDGSAVGWDVYEFDWHSSLWLDSENIKDIPSLTTRRNYVEDNSLYNTTDNPYINILCVDRRSFNRFEAKHSEVTGPLDELLIDAFERSDEKKLKEVEAIMGYRGFGGILFDSRLENTINTKNYKNKLISYYKSLEGDWEIALILGFKEFKDLKDDIKNINDFAGIPRTRLDNGLYLVGELYKYRIAEGEDPHWIGSFLASK